MKISQLQALVTVVDHSNFSSAALQLGVTQSTISHAIATLEEELGVVLLMRGRHGATLTHEGSQILEDARQILRLTESIQKKAGLVKGLQSGQVRVACVRSVATHFLPEAIAQFRSKFPSISVVLTEHLHYIEVEQTLREGKAEIGFIMLPTTDEFEAWELFRDEFVALLPPGTLHPDVALTWDHLASYPMIMSPLVAPHRHTQTILDHVTQFGCKLKIESEVKEDSTIIGMVKRGLGASIMARLAAEPIPERVQIRSLPVPLERTVGVATLADALLPRAAFAFLDTLKEVCQQLE